MRKEVPGKHSIYTHFPKDRNCEIRTRTKTTRAPCRKRTGEAIHRAENFGELITADQKVLSEGWWFCVFFAKSFAFFFFKGLVFVCFLQCVFLCCFFCVCFFLAMSFVFFIFCEEFNVFFFALDFDFFLHLVLCVFLLGFFL